MYPPSSPLSSASATTARNSGRSIFIASCASGRSAGMRTVESDGAASAAGAATDAPFAGASASRGPRGDCIVAGRSFGAAGSGDRRPRASTMSRVAEARIPLGDETSDASARGDSAEGRDTRGGFDGRAESSTSHASRAARSGAIDEKRSLGAFARHVATKASSDAVTRSTPRSLIGIGGRESCAISTSLAFSHAKGSVPVTMR